MPGLVSRAWMLGLCGLISQLTASAMAQAEASEARARPSDVYSTGVTLYELLVGHNPFDGRQQAEIYRKIVELEPRPVDELRDDVSTELAAVVWRAMHKDLTLRFAHAADFATALRGVLRRSQDEVGRTLAAQIRADFLGDLPAQMALETLSARELAWRVPRSKPLSPAPAQLDVREPPQATVRVDVDPEILARAASSHAPPKAVGRLSRGIAGAALSAVIGALAALGAWLAIAREPPVQERMLVIARESPTRGQAVEAQAPPARAPEAREAAVSAIATAPAVASLPPTAAPDACQLSRVFARKQRQLQGCFLRHAAGMQDVPQVVVHFRVDRGGAVEEASLSPRELSAQPLGQCLLQIARGTRFGAFSRSVSFHIPLSAQKVE